MLIELNGKWLLTGIAITNARVKGMKSAKGAKARIWVSYEPTFDAEGTRQVGQDKIIPISVLGEYAAYASRIRQGDCVVAIGERMLEEFHRQNGQRGTQECITVGSYEHGFISYGATGRATAAERKKVAAVADGLPTIKESAKEQKERLKRELELAKLDGLGEWVAVDPNEI